MKIIVQLFPVVFFMAYMLVAFVWPSVRTYRRTGINPLVFGSSDSAHDYVGRVYKIILALIPVSLVLSKANDKWYDYLLPAYYLEADITRLSGILLCLISFAWTVVAQWQMGNSWRIGIDEKHETALVTKGLFGCSRNPIFLGMIITLVGVFLLQPNALTFLSMSIGYILIHVQVRLEEAFLSMQHGADYTRYKRQVPRFISFKTQKYFTESHGA